MATGTLTNPALTPEVIAQSNAAAGFTISPFFSELTVSANQPTSSAIITLYNGGTDELRLTTTVRPLSQLNAATGSLAVTDESAWLAAISLDTAATAETAAIVIPPQTSQLLTVTVTQEPALNAGGNYALITFHDTTESTSDNNQLGLNRDVNALLFVINDTGQLARELILKPLNLPRISTGLPASLDVTFTNPGNTHVHPYGEVTVTVGNVRYAQGIINEGSRLLLPNNELTLPVSLMTSQPIQQPRMYTVSVRYHADGGDPVTYTDQLLIVPPLFVYYLLALLLLVWLLGKVFKRRVSK